MTGLLLFAHGARDPAWSAPFEAVLAAVRAHRADLPVRLAYLEFMQPDLSRAVDELVADGCGAITVVPLFLGAGGHVRKDVPCLIAAAQARHPALRIRLRPAAGEAPAVIGALAATALNELGEPG